MTMRSGVRYGTYFLFENMLWRYCLKNYLYTPVPAAGANPATTQTELHAINWIRLLPMR